MIVLSARKLLLCRNLFLRPRHHDALEPSEQFFQFRQVHGLDKVKVDTGLSRVIARLLVPVARNSNEKRYFARWTSLCTQSLGNFKAAHSGHTDVQQNYVGSNDL